MVHFCENLRSCVRIKREIWGNENVVAKRGDYCYPNPWKWFDTNFLDCCDPKSHCWTDQNQIETNVVAIKFKITHWSCSCCCNDRKTMDHNSLWTWSRKLRSPADSLIFGKSTLNLLKPDVLHEKKQQFPWPRSEMMFWSWCCNPNEESMLLQSKQQSIRMLT